MAKRFSSTFYSAKSVLYVVEIWDSAYSGAVEEFTISGNNFQLQQSGSGEKILNHMSPTSCQFDFFVQNTTHEGLITDLIDATEGRFTIAIFQTTTTNLYWAGQIVADIGSIEEAYYPYAFTIRATDGIGLLKTVDYKDTTAAYTGKDRAIDIIKKCLKKLPYVAVHYTSSSPFVSTILDVWADGMTNISTGTCALYQSYIDNSVWQTYDKGVEKYTNCYDVIDNILKPLFARITQRNGIFLIENIFYRTETSVIQRTYSRDGGLLGAGNYTQISDINQTASGALLAGAQYEFFPGLSKAQHTYKSNTRRNFLESATNLSNTGSLIYVKKPIDANGNNTTLRLTGNIAISIKSLAPIPVFPTAFEPFCIVFKLDLFLDTVGLYRPYTVQPTFQVTYGATEWLASSGFYIAVRIDNADFLKNLDSSIFTLTQGLDIITPFLPESCEDFSISFNTHTIQKYSGGVYSDGLFEITYSFSDQWLEAYSFGSPAVTSDEIEYETINTTNTTNTATLEQGSLIGTSSDPNSLGALWVKPASTFVLANVWQTGSATPNTLLEQIVTKIAMSGQYAPTKRLNGVLYGTIDKLARVLWEGEYYLFLSGTWNADMDELTGDWVLLRYDVNFTPSPPIKKLITKPGTPTSPISNGLGGATYDVLAKPPAALLYPVAATTSSVAMLPGAITTLPISGTATDGDFYIGDTVTIVNPLTGEFTNLTVTANSVAGDTSVAVSGTLSGQYPANAPIIKKPKIGGSDLPPLGSPLQVLQVNAAGTGLQYYSQSQQTTTGIDYTFALPAKRWAVAVSIESAAQTITIGKTSGAGDYSTLDVVSGEPNTVTLFVYGGASGTNIFFAGISVSTIITILTV
jgi:hypothetical protein